MPQPRRRWATIGPGPEIPLGSAWDLQIDAAVALMDVPIVSMHAGAISGELGNLSPLERSGSLAESSDRADPVRLREFNLLWNSCRVSVRAYLSSLIVNRSDIEDCVQEVALIAWNKGPVDQGERAFLGHCLASARFIGLAASRKLGGSRVRFLPPDVALSLADEVMRQEEADPAPTDRILALRACMTRLDEGQRRLLSLRYAADEGASLEQTAINEGKKPDALYKKLQRLRAALRECVTRRLRGEVNPA